MMGSSLVISHNRAKSGNIGLCLYLGTCWRQNAVRRPTSAYSCRRCHHLVSSKFRTLPRKYRQPLPQNAILKSRSARMSTHIRGSKICLWIFSKKRTMLEVCWSTALERPGRPCVEFHAERSVNIDVLTCREESPPPPPDDASTTGRTYDDMTKSPPPHLRCVVSSLSSPTP